MKNLNRKLAFTLAEVLITLGIIGIVAALTLPMFLSNYQEKQFIPKIKKAYSMLAQGVTTSEVTNAAAEHWNYKLSAENFYNEYLKDYFIVNEKTTVGKAKTDGMIPYINMNGTTTDAVVANDNSIILHIADGCLVFISDEQNDKFKTMAIDINGNKKPNIVGKDLFLLAIQNPYGLTPYGFANGGKNTFGSKYEMDSLLESKPDGCRNSGAYCLAYIMYNNWEMGNKYPR
ncbi:MAG: type II secretion system protein [Clostridiaceae bacterium]|nr:type II secretion system protein [Clostridiaceae bacterium]